MVVWINIVFKENEDIWINEEIGYDLSGYVNFIMKIIFVLYKWRRFIRLVFDYLYIKYIIICFIYSYNSYFIVCGEKVKNL